MVDSHPWSGLWLPRLRAGVSIRGPQRNVRICGRARQLGRGWLRCQTSRSSPGPVRRFASDLAELLHPVCAKRKDGVWKAGHVVQEGGAISFKEPSVALQGFYARPFVLGSNARTQRLKKYPRMGTRKVPSDGIRDGKLPSDGIRRGYFSACSSFPRTAFSCADMAPIPNTPPDTPASRIARLMMVPRRLSRSVCASFEQRSWA